MPSPEDDIINLYRRHSDAWAKLRESNLKQHKWFDKFIALLPDNASVLDLGSGTGLPFARYMNEHGLSVTGVDASPEMIAHARENLETATWVVADMRGLNLDEEFHGIVAWNSSFHLSPEDQRKLFPVFARHSRVNTALIFTSGPSDGLSMGEFEGEPLYHASLSPQEYDDLLIGHGFEVIDYIAEDPECSGQTVWLARYQGV